MIRVAHILEEVEPELYEKSEKGLLAVQQAFSRMDYAIRVHGIEHCIPNVVEFYRTQANKRYPNRAAYSDHVLNRIRGHEGDVIVLTESWHRECFKGLIIDGMWDDLPVIEMRQWKNRKVPEIIAQVTGKLAELPTCQKRSAFKTLSVQEIISS